MDPQSNVKSDRKNLKLTLNYICKQLHGQPKL